MVDNKPFVLEVFLEGTVEGGLEEVEVRGREEGTDGDGRD